MAKEHSFDISAKIDMQHFKNAINLVEREVSNRYDFKGTTYDINYRENDKLLVLVASSDNKLEALVDIVIAKLLVSFGACSQISCGDIFFPLQPKLLKT
jgi:uncharacterized protein YajQ (UPF0234 family)